MSKALQDNISIQAGKHIDDRYLNGVTPYADVAEVNAAIVLSRRYSGLTVLIVDEEYWYLDGITDVDLVLKTADPGVTNTFENGLTDTAGVVKLGGELTGDGATITVPAGKGFYIVANDPHGGVPVSSFFIDSAVGLNGDDILLGQLVFTTRRVSVRLQRNIIEIGDLINNNLGTKLTVDGDSDSINLAAGSILLAGGGGDNSGQIAVDGNQVILYSANGITASSLMVAPTFIDFTAGAIHLNGAPGSAGQFIAHDGTWQTPVGPTLDVLATINWTAADIRTIQFNEKVISVLNDNENYELYTYFVANNYSNLRVFFWYVKVQDLTSTVFNFTNFNTPISSNDSRFNSGTLEFTPDEIGAYKITGTKNPFDGGFFLEFTRVTEATGGSSNTFENGLTDTAGVVSLGGALLANTAISGAFDLGVTVQNVNLEGATNVNILGNESVNIDAVGVAGQLSMTSQFNVILSAVNNLTLSADAIISLISQSDLSLAGNHIDVVSTTDANIAAGANLNLSAVGTLTLSFVDLILNGSSPLDPLTEFIRADGTFAVPPGSGGGGITSDASATELTKSDGTNITHSNIFNPSAANLTLGSASVGGDRTIKTESSSFQSQLFLAVKRGNLVLYDSEASGDAQMSIGGVGNTLILKHRLVEGSHITGKAGTSPFTLQGHDGVSSGETGGNVLLKGGDGQQAAGSSPGGSITIKSGLGRAAGAGPDGNIILDSLTGKLIITQATASKFVRTGTSKELVTVNSATQAEMLTGTDDTKPVTPLSFASLRSLARISCAVAAGTMDLNSASKREVRFENTTAISSNCTITFSNDTNCEVKTLDIYVTGSIVLTLPSSVVMQEDESRWSNALKTLTLYGTTASPFELSFTKAGSLFKLKASTKYYTS